MGIKDIANSRERLKLITLEYSIESDGNFIDEPVVELFARDAHGERRFIEVEGFYPSFYVTESEFLDKQADILQESMVRSCEVRDAILDKQTRMNGSVKPQKDAPRERLDNTKLVKIYTVKPSQVKKLRDFFDWHGEADVFFTNRFLVESDIHRGFTIPAGEDRVHIDDVEATSEDEVPDVEPRMHTVDIEVWSGGEFPDTTNPTKPVTAITAHDSYEDSYFCGVLNPESVVEGATNSWGKDLNWEYPDGISDDQISVEVYDNENELLADYFEYLARTDPDLMTGWNCMPSGTEVKMASGETKVIEDVEIGDTVVGMEDGNTVTAQVTDEHTSQKEEFTIETEFGCVKSSKDHRFLTIEDGELTYRKLENLESGDFVVKPRKYNTNGEVPLLSELVPLERQQFSNEDIISEWRSEQDRGYRVEAAEMFDSTPGYMGRDSAWNPEKIKTFSGSIPSNTERRYARTDIHLDRKITPEEMYKAGLIASDGHMSERDSRISFYNTEDVLHSVFDGKIYEHDDYKEQRVLNMAMAYTFNGLGIPFGDKSNKGMELSKIYEMPEEYISQFLAGFIDGDGSVSNGAIYVAIKSDKTKSWIQKLFSRLGITSSISNKGLYVHKSRLNLNNLSGVLSYMRLDRKVESVGKNFRGGGESSKIPEQIFESDPQTESQSRYNGTFTRDSSEVIEYNELQFVEIQSITSSGRSTMYDISTTANSFIAEGFAVHNCSRNDIGSGFDYPYLINRADAINEWSYQDITYDGGRIFVTNRGAPVVDGREMFDMLQAYKKTQIHEKRSYALEYIAQEELGQGKEDIADLDEGWLHNPVQFIKYNIRDVTAVVEIEQSKNVLEIYDHIRSITGATYSEIADSNIGIIDVLFLRSAKERGYALPTSERPDVQHYWGAYVFDPVPGKHENVVYPDLSSLYPNLFRDMNASPETIIGDEADLRESQYSKDDCHTIYVDERDENVKKEADEPQRSEVYVLKPDVKESFVRDVIGDLIQLKYKYKSDEYPDEAYGAAKRITNSCFTPDTKVMTTNGRVKIDELSIGDNVYSINTENGEVEEKKITDTQKFPNYDGDIISINNQSVDFKVTPDHDMLLSDGNKCEARNLTSHNKFYNSWSWSGNGIDVPDNVSSIFDTSDDYIKFAGWFVSEGSLSIQEAEGYKYEFASISQHTDTEYVESLIENINCTFSDGPNYRTYNENLVAHCKEFGDSSEKKHLPFSISELTTDQAYILRDVLLEADGNNGYYYTISEELVEQISKLALKTSMNPLIHKRQDGIYRVSMKCDGENYVSSHRDLSVESNHTDGVYCVTVEDNHTLLAGRNGKYQWVGNCYGVMGDSVSYGKGFRLFDWRIAESITLAGRDVIKHTASEFQSSVQNMGYKDAKIIAGDTDSAVCELPSADGIEETLEASHNAADYVDSTYPEFMKNRFGIENGNMEVEIESYSESAFFMDVKKKYAQRVRWDEGKYVDEIEYKGFKLVRSDSAIITGDVQRGVLNRILTKDEPKTAVKKFLKEKYDSVLDGEVDPADIGIPCSISSEPMDYGWSEDDDTGEIKYFTPQPHIRGARYATAYIDGEDINSGSKPLMFYVTGVRANNDLPETYDYEDRFSLNAPKDKPDANRREMKELDREVDAIAVEDVHNIPDEIEIDWEKMAEKTIEDAVNNIAVTMGWEFSDLVSEGTQTGLADYM